MTTQTASAELRANWRADWLSSIQELADLEMQRATWLNPHNDNLHYSFVEYVGVYFDDLLLGAANGGYAARIAEGLLSDEEAAAASTLHALLDRYEAPIDDYDHRAILEDPAWHRVVGAAREAQASLSTIVVQPEERASLLLPSEYAIAAAARGG
jgi:hypothetical protein